MISQDIDVFYTYNSGLDELLALVFIFSKN